MFKKKVNFPLSDMNSERFHQLRNIHEGFVSNCGSEENRPAPATAESLASARVFLVDGYWC